ncbi:MAG: 50S ribosome-binding GTPase [Lachnospiraceae bacterium]|nr:50S ribosome-binding GTPase [Lachnospiraceae bacterium]
MINLSEKEVSDIAKYCGQEYATRYLGIKARADEQIVKIVNTGMVSSGKSSLYNVLIDSIESEHFPTGAARTTTMSSYYDVKNISYIDTPGIDVRAEDDSLAFNTVMEADIIMMIHNINMGPLVRSEMEWLERIVEKMSSIEACKSRLIFVCTWKDTIEKDDDYQDIIVDVKNAVFNIVGAEIPFFEVSVKKYLDGVKKNKEVLAQNSGIYELKSYLEQYADEYLQKKNELDRAELMKLFTTIRYILSDKKDGKNKEIQKIANRVKETAKSKRGTWKEIFAYFSSKRRQYDQELNNL